MTGKTTLTICAALLASGWSIPALGQAAAETAVILSGTGQGTGSASRSLGGAVSGSMNRAADAIAATRNGGAAPSYRRRRSGGGSGAGHVIPPGGDMLEGTDAPTYRLGNGASIRVSGRLVQGAGATCAENCPAAGAGARPAP